MCINCLNNKLEAIAECEREVKKHRDTLTCVGCKNYYNCLLDLNNDCKILVLTKIKRNVVNSCEGRKVKKFEKMVELRIKNHLNFMLENIDDSKDECKEGLYLSRMNDLKGFSDFIENINEADHR